MTTLELLPVPNCWLALEQFILAWVLARERCLPITVSLGFWVTSYGGLGFVSRLDRRQGIQAKSTDATEPCLSTQPFSSFF